MRRREFLFRFELSNYWNINCWTQPPSRSNKARTLVPGGRLRVVFRCKAAVAAKNPDLQLSQWQPRQKFTSVGSAKMRVWHAACIFDSKSNILRKSLFAHPTHRGSLQMPSNHRARSSKLFLWLCTTSASVTVNCTVPSCCTSALFVAATT